MEGNRLRKALRAVGAAAATATAMIALAGPAAAADGAQTYADRCAGCHGAEGEGRGSFPALDGNPLVDDEAAVAEVIRSGRGVMPGFPQLGDEDLADLTAFMRTTWGTAPAPDGSGGTGTTATSPPDTGGTATTSPGGEGGGTPPAGPGVAATGEALFLGSTAFESGAPPCVACHSAGANGGAGGARLLGTDLTLLAERAGGAEGISGMLATPAFPVMLAAYEGKPLTEQERAHLGAYFEGLAATGESPDSLLSGRLWLLGAAGAALLFVLMGLFWPRHRITAAERLRGGSR